MILGIVYALLSAFFYAVNNLFNKKLSEELNEYEALVYAAFFLLFFAGGLNFVLGSFIFNLSVESLIFLVSASIIGFVALLFLFKSFEHLPVGIILTLANIFPLFTLLFATFYHNLSFSFWLLIPLLIIFLGTWNIHYSRKEHANKAFIYMPLITAFGWGYYSFSSYSLLELNMSAFTVAFYLEAGVFLVGLCYALLFRKLSFSQKKLRSNLPYALGAGIFLTAGTLFIMFALERIHPAIASSIATSDIIFASVLSYVFFKEKLSKQELVGISIIILGLLMYFFIS